MIVMRIPVRVVLFDALMPDHLLLRHQAPRGMKQSLIGQRNALARSRIEQLLRAI